MDMNTFALRVNVCYLKKQSLMQPKAAGINGSQIGFILDGSNRIDNGPDFFDAQNSGKSLIPFGIDKFQGMPVPFEHVDEEEFNTAVAYSHSRSGPLIVVFSVEEIILKLLLGDSVRGFPVKVDQHPD